MMSSCICRRSASLVAAVSLASCRSRTAQSCIASVGFFSARHPTHEAEDVHGLIEREHIGGALRFGIRRGFWPVIDQPLQPRNIEQPACGQRRFHPLHFLGDLAAPRVQRGKPIRSLCAQTVVAENFGRNAVGEDRAHEPPRHAVAAIEMLGNVEGEFQEIAVGERIADIDAVPRLVHGAPIVRGIGAVEQTLGAFFARAPVLVRAERVSVLAHDPPQVQFFNDFLPQRRP